jgi:hypothetical protein
MHGEGRGHTVELKRDYGRVEIKIWYSLEKKIGWPERGTDRRLAISFS